MKRYSKEFKEEALKLSDEIGVKKAAQQLGIAYFTLADWRSIRRNTPPVKPLSAEEQTASESLSVRFPNFAPRTTFSRMHSVFSQKTARSKSV